MVYRMALEQQSTGGAEQAVQLYLEAVALYPQFQEAHQNLAVLYENLGNPSLSIYHNSLSFEAALRRADNSYFVSSALNNLLTTYLSTREINSAMNLEAHPAVMRYINLLYRVQMLEQPPSELPATYVPHAGALFTLSKVLLTLGQAETANNVTKRLLRFFPTHGVGLMNAAGHAFVRQNYTEAESLYMRAIVSLVSEPDGAQFVNLVVAYNNLGQSRRQAGRLNDALTAFDKAARLCVEAIKAPHDPIGSKQLHDYLRWSEENFLTVQLLLNDWGRGLERREAEIEAVVLHRGRKGSEPEADVPCVDPFTFSLNPFASRMADREACRLCCPVVEPDAQLLSRNKQRLQNTFSRAKTSPNMLHVGYLSYDWRDHPMVTMLLHVHSASSFLILMIMSFAGSTHAQTRDPSQPLLYPIHCLLLWPARRTRRHLGVCKEGC